MTRRILAAAALAAALVAAPVAAQNAVGGASYDSDTAAAIALLQAGQPGDALAPLTQSAQRDNVSAQVMLGLIYFSGSQIYGQEVKQDLDVAGYWFGRAAANGDPVGQMMLARVDTLQGLRLPTGGALYRQK
jgi:TPR repeat protein